MADTTFKVTIVDDLGSVDFERRCYAPDMETAVSDSIKAGRALGYFKPDNLNNQPMLSITVRQSP